LGDSEKTTGVLITEVDPDSEADGAGLRSGMMVLKVDQHPVNTNHTSRDVGFGWDAGPTSFFVREKERDSRRKFPPLGRFILQGVTDGRDGISPCLDSTTLAILEGCEFRYTGANRPSELHHTCGDGSAAVFF